ncbi:unnamed protein product [Lactuca virosa]|uniref:SET domain-containing protein n=1 Tax=Lactuca virosa TaxID=75947 RepID=A0AAU9P5H4_9ASTR|nr:unnamed protein product [Lactuca virosa]
MEKLKSAISQTLILSISQSNPRTLPNTCSSLHDFLNQLPQFHQMVEDLAYKDTSLFLKNKESALEFKLKGNNCFSKGDNSNALQFYTQALRFAPRDVNDMGKNLVATLYVNRAAVLQKMGLFVESLQDCNLALTICRSYSKAWYRRGKANTSMGNYDNAVRDFKVSLCMEQSINGKKQIEDEINLILDQHHMKDFPPNVAKVKDSNINDQSQQIQLQCVTTETKGRGMVCLTEIPPSTLLHTEEPYAAIISKEFRETHCHFCFNELPENVVPCPSCSMALYCSQFCQENASWQDPQCDMKKDYDIDFDLEKYVESVTKSNVNINQTDEHKHECGANWSAALPSEIVLAGRVIVKYIKQQGHFGNSRIVNLDLCHNYARLDPETKLEFHISSIILLKCLHHFYSSEFQLKGETISQCVLLLSQIQMNSMAIVRIKSSDSSENHTTSTIEQVRVGQAIYLSGSMFNHSCQPNIHTYFLSRTLNIRAIKFIPSGQPLELSYGPQVGQWRCNERQSSLRNQYAFICSCASCTQTNLSDLVIEAFRCSNPSCSGVVLDCDEVSYENRKVTPFGSAEYNKVKKVARLLCDLNKNHWVEPGFCLNCGGMRGCGSLHGTLRKGEICKRLFESGDVVASGLTCLDMLKKIFHPNNKRAAEVEDHMAKVFCGIGELQRARHHCKASIKVLEKLYGEEHIVIGNELVKLASIQLSLGEKAAFEETRNRIKLVFSLHYGSHVDVMFPHLHFLK